MKEYEHNHYRIIRMRPNAFRAEWVNIGVLMYDKQAGRHTVDMLPIGHPKVESVVLKGMTSEEYHQIKEIVRECFSSFDDEQRNPFDENGDVNDFILLLRQFEGSNQIRFSHPSIPRGRLDLKKLQSILMDTYVN